MSPRCPLMVTTLGRRRRSGEVRQRGRNRDEPGRRARHAKAGLWPRYEVDRSRANHPAGRHTRGALVDCRINWRENDINRITIQPQGQQTMTLAWGTLQAIWTDVTSHRRDDQVYSTSVVDHSVTAEHTLSRSIKQKS